MPIFEYLCDDCGTKFEKLVRNRASTDVLMPVLRRKPRHHAALYLRRARIIPGSPAVVCLRDVPNPPASAAEIRPRSDCGARTLENTLG
jgi:hypothetical protein